MDGYTLAAQLRRTRRRYRLSATSQALYYELVALANEERWPAIFNCSNGELMSAMGVTENTLILARQELIRAGLISYKSQKNKRLFSEYSFTSTSEFDAKADVNTDAKADAHAADYNKLKQKPKQKQIAVVVSHAAAFEFFRSTQNKRLLMEKHKLTEDEIESYFRTFYDSKIDLGDLDHKTLEDTAKNFYYWLPKHLAAQQNGASNVKRTASTVQPERGVAAALQFTDVVMRK
jgi:hypothetical protein